MTMIGQSDNPIVTQWVILGTPYSFVNSAKCKVWRSNFMLALRKSTQKAMGDVFYYKAEWAISVAFAIALLILNITYAVCIFYPYEKGAFSLSIMGIPIGVAVVMYGLYFVYKIYGEDTVSDAKTKGRSRFIYIMLVFNLHALYLALRLYENW